MIPPVIVSSVAADDAPAAVRCQVPGALKRWTAPKLP
jgi:hypothetical protein